MKINNQVTIIEIVSNTREEILAKELIWQVFLEFEGKDYSSEGLATFQQFISTDNLLSMRNDNNFIMWGYFINQRLVGIIGCKNPCHLTLLFVDKNYHHKGIAKQLLLTATDYYKQNKNAIVMTVNSSLYAIEAYKKMGFIPNGSIQTYHGISFYPMTRNI